MVPLHFAAQLLLALQLRMQKVNSPLKSSTYWLLLLIQAISWPICGGVDFLKPIMWDKVWGVHGPAPELALQNRSCFTKQKLLHKRGLGLGIYIVPIQKLLCKSFTKATSSCFTQQKLLGKIEVALQTGLGFGDYMVPLDFAAQLLLALQLRMQRPHHLFWFCLVLFDFVWCVLIFLD